MPEVIIFHGPPHSGKTLYYKQHLKATHHRISADELYRDHPGWGLRNVVLGIVSYLQQGRDVVIDDENWSRRTRESYIKSISEKMPCCQFVCYTFRPADAFECLWRREWALAQHFLEGDLHGSESTRPADIVSTEARIHAWFSSSQSGSHVQGPDDIHEVEGWQKVQSVDTSLTAESSYKFELPALFLEWSGVKDHYCEGLLRGLRVWKDCTTCGRIIVIAYLETGDMMAKDKSSEESSVGDHYETLLNEVKEATERIGRELEIPIYFLIVTDQEKSTPFTKLQEPGIMSFLQRMHCLNLEHPGTVCIHQSSKKERPLFCQTGLKQFHISAICKDPFLLRSCNRARILSPPHAAIMDIKFFAEQGSANPHVPLCKRATHGVVDTSCSNYVAEEIWGRVVGVSCHSKRIFNLFQEEYVANASHISSEVRMSSKIPLFECPRDGSSTSAAASQRSCQTQLHQSPTTAARLPPWMMAKRKTREESEGKRGAGVLAMVSPHKPNAKKSKSATETPYSTLPKTVYCMTIAELREAAAMYLEENGEDEERIPTSPDEDDGVSLSVHSDQYEADGVAAASDSDTQEGHLHTSEDDETGAGRVESHAPGDGKDETGVGVTDEEGVASIITDFFPDAGRCKKPPPKKKK